MRTRKTRAMPPLVRKKLVVVGDGECGKTCLLLVYSRDEFPEHYVPTIFENYVAELQVGNQTVQLALWDTAGQEDYDRLRPLSYPDTDVLLLCFAIDNPDSFQNVDEKWLSEISHFCPKVPRILVGTKKDLRNDERCKQRLAELKTKPVTVEEGQMMATKIQATAYIECSAKTRDGVQDVFEVAAKAALQRRYRTKRSPQCSVL
ncbi:hypothetical protein NP493_1027g00017 [Ridgeia piscesae]|uniref:Uncharacterized protein n=1 Tax=Ridgeia piscesae TaxID=27915 RepID=A0AAD9NKM4_RIDPI|nr:hypothetical protein NP493_1027g00017 [Ridgeia piscesae]